MYTIYHHTVVIVMSQSLECAVSNHTSRLAGQHRHLLILHHYS